MRSILLLSLVGALAAPAAAGDIDFSFGFHKGGRHAVSVTFGHRSHHRYVPGHYETVTKEVWVAGGCETVWQPAQWGWRRDRCGHRVRYLIRPAGYVQVHTPGRWECVKETVWVPGRYVRC
jgi:hypothetical protein